MIWLERGNMKEAETWKIRLEVLQRADRALRQNWEKEQAKQRKLAARKK
jgi:hypothetical protein